MQGGEVGWYGCRCGDGLDLVNGRPTGSIRVSFGYMSSKEEVSRGTTIIPQVFRLVDLVKMHFVETVAAKEQEKEQWEVVEGKGTEDEKRNKAEKVVVQGITVYPGEDLLSEG